ncbi:MAG: DUF3810 family protein [Clostridiales bacterium]|jgi:hypothetical protein|nr:DUF3810 family protein [Clostridiales bacterium]
MATERKLKQVFNTFTNKAKEHKVFTVFCVLFVISAAVYITSRLSTPFAEFWARYFSSGIRFITAKITSLFPFSIAEAIILLIPLGVGAVIFVSVKMLKKDNKKGLTRLLLSLLSLLMTVCILFGLGFGPCYFRNSLSDNLKLSNNPVSPESLYNTALWLTESINEVIPSVSFSQDGESHMPRSYGETTVIVNDAFNETAKQYDFISSFSSDVKILALSDLITYTHISGVYSFFTGEANVNVNYPDFIFPYTVAHEMSHQRGIAREDEANFMAFLVCINSDDPYVKYSGYLNVLREVMSALYKADRDLYNEYRKKYYPDELSKEISSYTKFFEKYKNSTASKVVSGTNNAYLSSQKVKEGVRSYNLVTNLAVSYYETVIAG